MKEHLIYRRAIGEFKTTIERYPTEEQAQARLLELESLGFSVVYGGAREMGRHDEWFVGLEDEFHTGF